MEILGCALRTSTEQLCVKRFIGIPYSPLAKLQVDVQTHGPHPELG